MYSLVIPVYKNEENLPSLLECLRGMSEEMEQKLEVVFVIDGSPDRCYPILKQQLADEPYPSQLILHSRNYGSFAAIRTGMQAAKGQYIAVMAADLQEPPELAIEFFRNLERDEADVVLGVRDGRDDPLISRLSSQLYWWFYRKFVIPEIPEGGVDMFGCNTAFKDELLLLNESHSSLIGLIFWLGFRRKTIAYKRREREHGKSAWTFKKKINYLMDSVFAFSDLPIKVLISLGGLGMVISLALAAFTLIFRVTGYVPVPGYATTVVTILFFGGLNALGLGIIGAYVWRAYGNTQGRPLSVVMTSDSFPAAAPSNHAEQ